MITTIINENKNGFIKIFLSRSCTIDNFYCSDTLYTIIILRVSSDNKYCRARQKKML